MINVSNVSKVYKIYSNPADRLKQSLFSGRKKFYEEFWPVKNINFTIRKGEIVGLIGANGSGKSTLLQLICGVLAPSSGVISKQGRVAALLELGSGFNPEFSGLDNLWMNASLLGLSNEEIQNKYQEIVDFSGLGDFIHQPVKTYSSGMIVRLAFAISSFVNADILVVDEALAVGDAGFQAKCLERMERLMNQGATVLLVTHDMQLVKRYCSRVIYLKQGEVAFDGEPEEATEIYLAETKENNYTNYQLLRESAPKLNSKMGFSNPLGNILEVKLASGIYHSEKIAVKQGEVVDVYVTAKVSTALSHPRIQLTIRDSRGYNLFGFNNYYGGQVITPDKDGMVKIKYSFDANLQLGEYAITIRLDDTKSREETNLIDKQVGICTFVVTAKEKTFEAVVNLNGRCEVNI